ncbi:hypothetical protein [Leptolyngbya sp. Heron Island J]|uniref:hypothetical protein n=1 Tax=Leptolyngbya sp. Heron Island J TaxID=1385935 RepID=UPI001268BAD3|nr:hypothetical protein [Leptolyngbya sp. Heron Island J]
MANKPSESIKQRCEELYSHAIAKPMDWQPGQWVECPLTQEQGKILRMGRSICISLGKGITLYTSPESLEVLGWRPAHHHESNSQQTI